MVQSESIIKFYLKKNKYIYKILSRISDSLLRIRDYSEKRLNLSYSLYYQICKIFFKRNKRILNKELIHQFHNRQILILDSYIPIEKAEEMRNSLKHNLIVNRFKSNYLNKISLPNKKISRYLRYLKDRFFKNILYYYNYPTHYLNQSYQVIDPLNNIQGFREELYKKFIPILNELMGSKSEIYRAWAYKTINIDKKETSNVQNSLHRDGDVWSAIKCIIYLSDVDKNNGPFCFRDIDGIVKPVLGKKGTVIFFKSALLQHKGSNTLRDDRFALSFTAYPSFTNKISEYEVRPDFVRKANPFFPQSNEVYLKDI